MYCIREDEEQRYGRNKETQINQGYINGGKYRRKFNDITESTKLNRLIYQYAKQMLEHRSGTEIEDMCWFDIETEEIICSKLNETDKHVIHVDDNLLSKLKRYEQIIPIHTHPSSMPPSPADFNCIVDINANFGIILCHNGKIFIYSAKRHVDEKLWNKYIEVFRAEGHNEYEAQLSAIDKIQDTGDIYFEEV